MRKLKMMIASVLLINPAFGDVIDGEDFVDPTRPLLFRDSVNLREQNLATGRQRNGSSPGFNVSFIRADGAVPVAVVNNARVTVGDLVGGAEVVSIARNRVTLLVDGQEQVISIFNPAVKTE